MGAASRPAVEWYTAAELASLALPGLPRRREHVSRRATVEGWQARDRVGRGGGREFAAASLPEAARIELLRRRLAEGEGEHRGAPVISAAVAASLTARQVEKLSGKAEIIRLFDAFAAGRSARSAIPQFVTAYNAHAIEAPADTREAIPRLSRHTLERMLRDRNAGETHRLAGTVSGGRPSFATRAPAIAEFLIGAAVRQPHLSGAQLHAMLCAQWPGGLPTERGTIALPSMRAIIRFLADYRRANAATWRSMVDPDGYKSAHRISLGRADAGIARINQRWEIDASPIDALCTDGRHAVYVAVDVFSRRMVALVTRTPKTDALCALLFRAIVAWGTPETIGSDNGAEFVSHRIRDVLARLGIAQVVAPPFTPEAKPYVERAIGTLQHNCISLLDGYIGHDVAERQKIQARATFAQRLGEDDAKTFAVALTAAELQTKIDAWIDNVYDHRVHRGIGTQPRLRALEGGAPRHIDDVEALRFLLLVPPADRRTRVVGKKGVAIDGRDYWCDDLVLAIGQTVEVRLDPSDLGAVYVFAAAKPWTFLGRAVNPELLGIDRRETAARAQAAQKSLMKEARAKLRRIKRKVDTRAVVDAMIAARDNETIVTLPIKGGSHTTEDLAQAAIASQIAAGATGQPQTPAPTPEETERHAAFVADFDAERRQRVLAETPEQRFVKWRRLDLALRRGKSVSDEGREWHAAYAATPEFKGQMLVAEQFGLDSPDDEDALGA